MSYQTILLDIDHRGIATLTLNRADRHNAISAQMIDEIRDAVDVLSDKQQVRGLILTGAGKSFCAGADLGWMKDNFHRSREQRIAQSENLVSMLHGLDTLGMLVVAKVNGQAFAGGIGLIAVCDVAIGVPESMFAVTETRLGLVPANISPYLVRKIGAANARRCFLNGHQFDGEEALRLGLLDKVVASEQLDEAVEAEMRHLLQCAPQAVSDSKKLIQYVSHRNPLQAREHNAALLADSWEGEEAQEGIRCFFDKLAPGWRP